MVLREIKERYSTRNFSSEKVPDEVIKKILEAARLAPSWVNTQPWHFIVVQDKKTKGMLSQLAHGQPHAAEASAVIVCCGDKNTWEKENYKIIIEARKCITPEKIDTFLNNPAYNPKLLGEEAVIYRTIEEVTYAIAYMTIEAQSNGVGACIIGGIGNELNNALPDVYEEVRKMLKIPDNLMVLILLAVGYAKEFQEKSEKIRKGFNEIISWEFYGNKK